MSHKYKQPQRPKIVMINKTKMALKYTLVEKGNTYIVTIEEANN